MKWSTKSLSYHQLVPLLLSLLIPSVLLALALPDRQVASAASMDDPTTAQLQPERPGRKAKLEVSASDAPVGQAVALTARTDRPESEAFVLIIRREGEPLDSGEEASGLEAACRSKAICTTDVVSQKRSTRKYAAAIYRCDDQGDICVLDEDATDADKVLVNWR